MTHYEAEKTFVYAADAERIWPAIAKTNLVSEIMGEGNYEAEDELQDDGSVLRRAAGAKLTPIAKRWTEDLGQWIYARFCRQRRWFVPDGSQFLDFSVRLEPDGENTRVIARVELISSNPAVWIGAKLKLLDKTIAKLMAAIESLIEYEIERSSEDRGDDAGDDPLAGLPYVAPDLDTGTAGRIKEARDRLVRLSGDDALADRLVDYLKRAPEDFLGRIRPLDLARAWRAGADPVVDLCLAAHRAGLLSLRWEILCPRCRNSKTPSLTLDDLPEQIHCSTCNIDYERDFSRNVELLFSPEPWLRPLPEGVGCMLGASTTPHIYVQWDVPAGETLVIDPPLPAGSYRVRAPQMEGQIDLDHDGSNFPDFVADNGRLTLGEPSAGDGIRLANPGAGRVTFVIEELAWRKNAITGDQAIARAAFRRYCPNQLLRPGDDVRISNVTLLFTDLKGSTSLYEAIGDTAAYKLVRDHFEFLTRAVEDHRGALVKTMGDAIMAAFTDGSDAVAAAIALQSGVAAFNSGRDDGGIVLKIGLHQGACIAVTADGRLDYFGSMVNLAARLQGESEGGDIVLSTALAEAVDIEALMPADRPFEMNLASASLRGFDRPVSYWRLVPRDDAKAPARLGG
jgi:class 3 adenylate cyclase